MRFYTKQYKYYCGIDLHAKAMYVCIMNQEGEILQHKNIHTDPQDFLQVVHPYREDLVVAVECIFTWYWIADLCLKEQIHFVPGHALYMKAISGGKTKNDKIDPVALSLLKTIPGIGKVLALTIFYEIHDIKRSPRVQYFVSYCRLVKCPRESSGKKMDYRVNLK